MASQPIFGQIAQPRNQPNMALAAEIEADVQFVSV